jgi:hypothetical protein
MSYSWLAYVQDSACPITLCNECALRLPFFSSTYNKVAPSPLNRPSPPSKDNGKSTTPTATPPIYQDDWLTFTLHNLYGQPSSALWRLTKVNREALCETLLQSQSRLSVWSEENTALALFTRDVLTKPRPAPKCISKRLDANSDKTPRMIIIECGVALQVPC